MIRTPPFVEQKELDDAARKLIEKGKAPCADQVKLESVTEGLCVQMLHVGPYEEEGRSIGVMNAFAEQQGLALHGRHHEIYLSDPRRDPAGEAQDHPAPAGQKERKVTSVMAN